MIRAVAKTIPLAAIKLCDPQPHGKPDISIFLVGAERFAPPPEGELFNPERVVTAEDSPQLVGRKLNTNEFTLACVLDCDTGNAATAQAEKRAGGPSLGELTGGARRRMGGAAVPVPTPTLAVEDADALAALAKPY